MANPSNPMDMGELKAALNDVLSSASEVAMAIPPPAGELIAGAIKLAASYAEKGLGVVESAVNSRIVRPLQLASPYIDQKYQTKVQDLIKARRMGLIEDAVKDWTAWKVGPGTEIIGLDHTQKARTDNDMQKLFQDTGMPHWMACVAAAVFARANGQAISARHWDDEACDVLGIPRTHDEAAIWQAGNARWDGSDEKQSYKGTKAGNKDYVAPTEYDKEWSNLPLDFNTGDLSGAGELTPAGLEFLKIAVTSGIEGGTYPSEQQLFYDWTIRPKGSSIKWWHSFTHWAWTNSAKFKAETEKKNLEYFAKQDQEKAARAQADKDRQEKASYGAGKAFPMGAIVLVAVVAVVGGAVLLGSK